jgi:hypothetical protein
MPRRFYYDPDDVRESREEIRRENEAHAAEDEMPLGKSSSFDEWFRLGKPDEFYSIWLAKQLALGRKFP